MTYRRRTVLASSLAFTAGLSGCLAGGLGGGSDGDDPTEEGTPSPEDGADGAANFGIDHPAMAGAENDPVLGPPPDEAEMGFLLVSEPSCNYCRDFHEETWEPMKTELIETGRLSFMYRPYPKVRQWAPKAAYGLLEVWNRDEDEFVPFMEWCYDNFHELGLNTADSIGAYLNENTDVDGDAVAEVVENFGRMDDVQESMDAAREAGMTTIPSYAILREGEVVETVTGGQSYANVKRMLGAD